MGIVDKVVNKTVDKAVNRTVTKVVDKAVDKVFESKKKEEGVKATEVAETIVTKRTEMIAEALLHCTSCGAAIDKDAAFCPSCGAPIDENRKAALAELEAEKESALEEIRASESDAVIPEEPVLEEEQAASVEEPEQPAKGGKMAGAWAKINDTEDTTDEFEKEDVEKNKFMAILSYFSWLVLIPWFGAKDSKFARFHAKQGIVLAIVEIVWWILQGILNAVLKGVPVVGVLVSVVMSIVDVVFVVLAVIGIINAYKGKAKKLPIIGKFAKK